MSESRPDHRLGRGDSTVAIGQEWELGQCWNGGRGRRRSYVERGGVVTHPA